MATLTTDNYMSVDGVPLNTFAYNITTWGGDREAPPALRGQDITIPGRRGKTFISKVEDSRTITLNMWVQGCLPNGDVPDSGDARAEFEHNFKMLRRLLFTPRRQVSLTKRFRDYSAETTTSRNSPGYGQTGYGDGSFGAAEAGGIITATGKAQFAGGLNIAMTGRHRGIFSVDLLMTDPYFYTDYISVPTMYATGTSSRQFDVQGDGRTMDVIATFHGALYMPRITVSNGVDQHWTQFNGGVNSADDVILDSKNFVAAYSPKASSDYRVNGLIQHGGDPFWMALDPGTAKVALTRPGSGAGAMDLKYKAAWL